MEENRFSYSWKTAHDSVRSPLTAAGLKVLMHLALTVKDHAGGLQAPWKPEGLEEDTWALSPAAGSMEMGWPQHSLTRSWTSPCWPCGATNSPFSSHRAGLPCLSHCLELPQVAAQNQLRCLWETFPERHCPSSQLDYLRNTALVGRKAHTFHQHSAIRICQPWEICSVNKWLRPKEFREEKPEVTVPKHWFISL